MTLFYSKEGEVEEIPFLGGGEDIFPTKLNDVGQLVGFGLNAENHVNAFIFDRENKMRNLGPRWKAKRSFRNKQSWRSHRVSQRQKRENCMLLLPKRGKVDRYWKKL